MYEDALTTDYSTQPWDTLTYVRMCTLKRVKLWKCSSCGAGFCLGGSRAGVFHRELLNQCFPCACVCMCVGARTHACVCVYVQPTLTFTFLPNLSLHLCAMEVSIKSSLENEKRDFCLIFKRRRIRFTGSTVFSFVFPSSRISLRSRIAVYILCPFSPLPTGRKKTSMETGTMCCSVQWLAGNIGAY